MYLLNTLETSKKLQLCPNTLINWRKQKIGLNFIKIGKNVRYTQEEVDRFLKNNVVEVNKEM